MKNKFDTQENGSMLGTAIQQARKAKKLTQEELGKRVGLPKSSISKIEKGLTHISFEDASLLMDAMGEKITIQVMDMKEPDEKRVERVRFVTIGVMWYAHSKQMTFADAYRYLLVYKGIQFLEDNYVYEQTLPRETLLSDLDKVCNRNRDQLFTDLAAYMVSEYDIEPRDAAGLVMNSPLTQKLYSSEEPITEQRVKALAEELLSGKE